MHAHQNRGCIALFYCPGFHTPKAVTYHEPTNNDMWLFMIGHSLGRMEACFAPSCFGAGGPQKAHRNLPYLATVEKKKTKKKNQKKGVMLSLVIHWPQSGQRNGGDSSLQRACSMAEWIPAEDAATAGGLGTCRR